MEPSDPATTVAAIVVALGLTSVVVPLLALAVQRRYRRAVHRSMLRSASGPGGGPPRSAPPALPPAASRPPSAGAPVEVRWLLADRAHPPTHDPLAQELQGRVLRRRRRAMVVAGLGSLTFGGVVAVLMVLSDPELVAGPFLLLLLTVLFAWPGLLAVGHVAGWRPGRSASALLLHLAVVGVVGAMRGSAGLVLVAAGVMVLGGLLLLPLTHPRIRATAPFLAAGVLVATVLLVLLAPGGWLWLAERIDPLLALLVVGGASLAAGGLVAAGVIVGVARRYERRGTSDRSLLITQWWMVYAAFTGLFLTFQGRWWGLAGAVLPLLALLAVTAAGTRLLLSERDAGPQELRLLLLRPFRSRRHSEQLFADVGRHWRELGRVQLIAGPDLATASLEPHEFLDHVRGRLDRRFVVDAADLERRLADGHGHRDRDGRFRSEGFFCHDDTWRLTVRRLASGCALVLLDARGFTGRDRGLAWELTTLVQHEPLERVVVSVDETTDPEAVLEVVRAAADHLPSTSPNHGRDVLTVRVLRLDDPPPGLDPYLVTLCAAVATASSAGADEARGAAPPTAALVPPAGGTGA